MKHAKFDSKIVVPLDGRVHHLLRKRSEGSHDSMADIVRYAIDNYLHPHKLNNTPNKDYPCQPYKGKQSITSSRLEALLGATSGTVSGFIWDYPGGVGDEDLETISGVEAHLYFIQNFINDIWRDQTPDEALNIGPTLILFEPGVRKVFEHSVVPKAAKQAVEKLLFGEGGFWNKVPPKTFDMGSFIADAAYQLELATRRDALCRALYGF